jgi:hypothetical protein
VRGSSRLRNTIGSDSQANVLSPLRTVIIENNVGSKNYFHYFLIAV